MGSIYALVALGFVLIYKSTSILNLAQGEFLMVGAYICLSMTLDFGLGFIASFVITLFFSVILGLGLDYDIFTLERIREKRFIEGLENEEAISQALSHTGSIISGAGIIMMIAFGGLMFSSSIILVQFGFILAFAIFLDTFFVRTILLPAIMGLADKWNWWPNKP